MRSLKPLQAVPPMRRDMDLLANRLPSTRALHGHALELDYEDGWRTSLTLSANRVRWHVTSPDGPAGEGEELYDAVEIRPGIFFVDFALADGSRAFSHVIDRESGRALTVWSEIADAGGTLDLRQLLRPARISGHRGHYEPVSETRELLGKRLFCEYSPEAALEHLYVNSATIVWQWLRSPPALALEVGIEAVTMWKLRDELFLISTRGPDPIQLTLLLDLQQMRNVGRLFGRGQFGVVDRRCGAKITFLGEFTYPPGYEPG